MRFLPIYLSILGSLGFLPAQDLDWPSSSLGSNSFEPLMENSPFTRSLNLNSHLVLTGFAEISGETVATVIDSENGVTHLVSGAPNTEGWTLSDFTGGADLNRAWAGISMNGEVVRVVYNEELLEKARKIQVQQGIRVYTGTMPNTKGKLSDKREGKEKSAYDIKTKKMWGDLSKDQQKRVKEILSKANKANPKMTSRDKGTLWIQTMERVSGSSR